MQEGDGAKPVTDQWLPPFVVVGDDDKPVGTIEVNASLLRDMALEDFPSFAGNLVCCAMTEFLEPSLQESGAEYV